MLQEGFSLIELILVLFLITLLGSLAYPYYQNNLIKSHRADALATLMQDQLILEGCYAQNTSYMKPCTLLPSFPHHSTQGFYKINLSQLKPTSYTLTARPLGNQIKDTQCASISIDQSNVKTALDSLGRSQILCWI